MHFYMQEYQLQDSYRAKLFSYLRDVHLCQSRARMTAIIIVLCCCASCLTSYNLYSDNNILNMLVCKKVIHI